jgi:hypothetical protein
VPAEFDIAGGIVHISERIDHSAGTGVPEDDRRHVYVVFTQRDEAVAPMLEFNVYDPAFVFIKYAAGEGHRSDGHSGFARTVNAFHNAARQQ